MEAARVDPLDLGRREERDLQVSLGALRSLASTAVARWHELDDEARLTLVREVHEVASDLGRLARQRWDAAATATGLGRSASFRSSPQGALGHGTGSSPTQA